MGVVGMVRWGDEWGGGCGGVYDEDYLEVVSLGAIVYTFLYVCKFSFQVLPSESNSRDHQVIICPELSVTQLNSKKPSRQGVTHWGSSGVRVGGGEHTLSSRSVAVISGCWRLGGPGSDGASLVIHNTRVLAAQASSDSPCPRPT